MLETRVVTKDLVLEAEGMWDALRTARLALAACDTDIATGVTMKAINFGPHWVNLAVNLLLLRDQLVAKIGEYETWLTTHGFEVP